MIVVQGWMRVDPEDAHTLRDAARTLVAATRLEPGNIAYAFAEDVNDPGLFHIVERWADDAAVAAHMTMPHTAAFGPVLKGLRDLHYRIARYDPPEERVVMER
jgi:quinol monooxygenase YgiN